MKNVSVTDYCDEEEQKLPEAATWNNNEKGFSKHVDSRQGEVFILNKLMHSDSHELVEDTGADELETFKEDVLNVPDTNTTCYQFPSVTHEDGNFNVVMEHVDIGISNVTTCNNDIVQCKM